MVIRASPGWGVEVSGRAPGALRTPRERAGQGLGLGCRRSPQQRRARPVLVEVVPPLPSSLVGTRSTSMARRHRIWVDDVRAPISGLGTGWRSLMAVKAPLVFHCMPEPFRLLWSAKSPRHRPPVGCRVNMSRSMSPCSSGRPSPASARSVVVPSSRCAVRTGSERSPAIFCDCGNGVPC